MDAVNLLRQARTAGLRLEVLDGRLKVQGRRRHAAMAMELLAREKELLDLLAYPGGAAPPDTTPQSPGDLEVVSGEAPPRHENEPPTSLRPGDGQSQDPPDSTLASPGASPPATGPEGAFISPSSSATRHNLKKHGENEGCVGLGGPPAGNKVLMDRVRGLDALELTRLSGDGRVAPREREACRQELLARVDAALAEVDAKVSLPDRFGDRIPAEQSMTLWLRRHRPDVAARWPDAPLDAPWFDWRDHVDRADVAALDAAWAAVGGPTAAKVVARLRGEPFNQA